MAGLKVETWSIDRLIPYARNPRRNDEQVDRMASAIKEFGFRIPIVARSDGSLVDGHLRLKAAQKLGLKEVPVALADELTEAQVKAFRILANKSANWAEWEPDLLKLELQELQELDFNLELTGFDAGELADIWLEGDAKALDEFPELKDGDKGDICEWNFTLTSDQKEIVKQAIEKAKSTYSFDDTGNANSNGNALSAICQAFIDYDS